MRLLAVVAVLVLPALARAAEQPKLEIDLSAPKEIYPDETLNVTAVIRNAGKEDVHVLPALDGAFDGLRGMVTYKWTVKKNAQVIARRNDIRRFDNLVNPISASELALVKPGKPVDPRVGSFDTYYRLDTPGKYTITLTYEFDPTGRDPVESPALLKRLQALPAATAKGEIEVALVPFPPAVAAVQDRLKAATARHQLVSRFAELTAKNPNATAAERDEAAGRLKRATAVLAEARDEYDAKLAEFRKKREDERKKK